MVHRSFKFRMIAVSHASMASVRGLVLIPLVLAFILCLASPLIADDPKKPGHDQDVMKLCREVEAQYRNKKDRDTERIMEIYQTFDLIFKKATPKEQKWIVKTIRKAYDIQPFPEDSAFMITGAACLSAMGKSGLDALILSLIHI